MFKNWKARLSSSNAAYIPTEDTLHESLLDEDNERAFDNNLGLQQKQPPLLIYWIYFTYGVAMLLPWNVFITASDYFSTRFSGSIYQDSFQNYFSAYFNCSNLISLAIFLWIRQKKSSIKFDAVIPLSINLIIFLYFALTSLTAPTAPATYFWTTISFMVLTGITTSLLQLSVFAEASQLSPKYIQGVMSGQGIAGVSVALFSLLTSLTLGQQHQDEASAFYYFFSALLVTLVAFVGRFALHKQPSYHTMIMHSSSAATVHHDAMIPMTSSNHADDSNDDPLSRQNEKNALWNIIIHKIPGYIGTVVYIYVITLALFPSITVQVQPISSIDPAIFLSLHFLLFNVGDWIGRTLPIFQCLQIFSPKHLLLWCLARTLFVPLFLNCNLSSNDDRPWINSDVLFFVLLLLFSISNGLLTSLVFMAAPKQRQITSSEKPLVGSMMSFFLVVGLALGGLTSFVLD